MSPETTTPADNILIFEVPGLGIFRSYKELPFKMLFQQERRELAKLVGGFPILLEMEALMQQNRDNEDLNKKQLAYNIANELATAGSYVRMKNYIFDVPKGFSLDTMSDDEYLKIFAAWENARAPFRPQDRGPEKEAPSPNDAGDKRTEAKQ